MENIVNERAADYLRTAVQRRIEDLDKEIGEIDDRLDVHNRQVEFDSYYRQELLGERESLARFLGVVL